MYNFFTATIDIEIVPLKNIQNITTINKISINYDLFPISNNQNHLRCRNGLEIVFEKNFQFLDHLFEFQITNNTTIKYDLFKQNKEYLTNFVHKTRF